MKRSVKRLVKGSVKRSLQSFYLVKGWCFLDRGQMRKERLREEKLRKERRGEERGGRVVSRADNIPPQG